jgi:hypothetical protein
MKRYAGGLAAAILGGVTFLALPQSSPVLEAQFIDPCAGVVVSESPALGLRSPLQATTAAKTRGFDLDPRGRHLDTLWKHRMAVARRPRGVVPLDAAPQDVGEIAVLHDGGDLMTRANPFDLADVAVRLTSNPSGGYDAEPAPYSFQQPFGDALALTDDDSREVPLPFAFTFFNQQYDRVFVNSDGNLTFTEPDTASTQRSVSRFLTGPPRLAPLFADLDPSTGGRVLAYGDRDRFSVTWCGVREFDRPETATMQVTLAADGRIEFHVSGQTTIRQAVVGASPGRTTDVVLADFSNPSGNAGGAGAVGELFTSTSDLDLIAVSRRFLATHPDEFDHLIVFTDEPLLTTAFAYEVTVSNDITGLGMPTFNHASDYGSAGRLQAMCNMDALSKYPDDPRRKFHRENNTLSILAHEVGHRWLAFLKFRDENAQTSEALLGRDRSHWSFFFDSDASVAEGNDIVDHGGGSFSTRAAVERYSLLDQYAMGLVDRSQVPPFFYVQNPENVVPSKTSESSPAVGVTFTGIRRDVTIDDVIAVMGPRNPSAADSPREYRQAFVYVVAPGRTADPVALEKLDRIRMAWDVFVSAATDSRMRVDTRLSW